MFFNLCNMIYTILPKYSVTVKTIVLMLQCFNNFISNNDFISLKILLVSNDTLILIRIISSTSYDIQMPKINDIAQAITNTRMAH